MEAGQSSRGRFSSFLFVRCQVKLQRCLLKASSVPLGRDSEFPRPSPGHFTWPRCSCQQHGTAATLHEPTPEEFPWMKTLQTAQGFYDIPSWPLLTSSLGCRLLLIRNCQCVLSRPISNEPLRYTQPSSQYQNKPAARRERCS